jgi:tRNA threonylcarbamoyladenosine modification (KEOPS) complex Cgi121 subunit
MWSSFPFRTEVETLKIWAKAYRCGKSFRQEEIKEKLVAMNPKSLVQTAKAEASSNEFLVEMLAAQTMHAESTGNLLAKKPEIDFLLRLGGTTQISRAISEWGAKGGGDFLVIVAGRKKINAPSDLEALELPRLPLTRAEVDRVELAALLNARRPMSLSSTSEY